MVARCHGRALPRPRVATLLLITYQPTTYLPSYLLTMYYLATYLPTTYLPIPTYLPIHCCAVRRAAEFVARDA